METYLEKINETRKNRDLSVSDVVSIDDLSKKDIDLILDLAKFFKETGNKKYSLLQDATIFNAFFEDSTRTRSSFELAGKKLGADVINISGGNTSVKKRETLLDTAEVLNSMRPEVVVIRTSKSGVPYTIAKHIKAAVINAGDGCHEHPSQGLLDALTIKEAFGRVQGLNVLVTGDILHSRVFGSLARIILKMGANLKIAAPYTLIPRGIKKVFKLEIFNNIEKALTNTDVVYALRVQEERGSNCFIPTLREFSKTFGISEARFRLANKNAILMHPGPLMRDIEVHSALVGKSESKYFNQVENGLAVRSALLYLLARPIKTNNKINNLV